MKNSSDPTLEEEQLTRPLDDDTAFHQWSLPELASTFSSSEDVGVPSLPTVEEVERIRAEAAADGRREGYAEGLEAGRADGLEQARDETERLQLRLRGWLGSLAEPLTRMDDEVGHQLGRLAMQIAAAVIRRELITKPEDIEQVAREALMSLPRAEARNIEITCHPDDLDALRDAAGEAGWVVRADTSVAAGGLLVDSGDARVDATLEARWAQMSERLLAAAVSGPTQIPPSEPGVSTRAEGRDTPPADNAGETTP